MTVARRLTKRVVDAAKPREARYEVWCGELEGFGVRVMPSGKRVFVVRYRTQDRARRRVTIGRYSDALTCDQARRAAGRVLARVKLGEDPAAEREAQRKAAKVAELCEAYELEHVPTMKLSTQRSERSLLEKVREVFGRKTVAGLQRADLERLRLAMRETPGAWNKVLGLISRMYNWGLQREAFGITANPTARVKKNRERRIERFLSPPERAALMRVLELAERRPPKTEGHTAPEACNVIRLLAMTGCRLGEILDLTWRMVDWERRCLALPDSKTGSKMIPLSGQALVRLERIRETQSGAGPNDRVCPGADGRCVSNLGRTWRRIRAEAGIEDVRLHDLRHSFASDAIMAGVPLQVVGKMLGHKATATTARYAHIADDVLHQAVARVGNAIEQRERDGANVTRLQEVTR